MYLLFNEMKVYSYVTEKKIIIKDVSIELDL